MLTYWYLAAVCLMYAPLGNFPSEPDLAKVDYLRPLIRAIAIQDQNLDARELYFQSQKSFRAHLVFFRTRINKYGNLPRLDFCVFLPSSREISDLVDMNFEYQFHAWGERLLYKNTCHVEEFKYWTQALDDAEKLRRIWLLAREANNRVYYVMFRRKILGDLRDAIGADNFAMGRMPYHLPFNRLAIIK